MKIIVSGTSWEALCISWGIEEVSRGIDHSLGDICKDFESVKKGYGYQHVGEVSPEDAVFLALQLATQADGWAGQCAEDVYAMREVAALRRDVKRIFKELRKECLELKIQEMIQACYG